MKTLRGELRCFSCSRYLGDFESHPDAPGADDFHLRGSEVVALSHRPLETDDGLRCSHCDGSVVTEHIDRITAWRPDGALHSPRGAPIMRLMSSLGCPALKGWRARPGGRLSPHS
jgi:hypothetical protein